ncbi:MAG: RNA methyltransferase [Clostridiales Family XIII bacterium]|nr:RNA methyltransferase [Clostridiales Family XIII bacterium]
MKTVVSRDNAALKAARKLASKSGRDKAGAFLLEGAKLIGEAYRAGLTVERVFVKAGSTDALKGLPAGLADGIGEDHLTLLTEGLFDELSSTVTPQPLLAVVRKPARLDMPAGGAGAIAAAAGAAANAAGKDVSALSILVLDRIADPGNVGTAIRTALAAGFDMAVSIRGTADIWSDKVIRGAAGSLFLLPAAEGVSAEDCAGFVSGAGIPLVVCSAGGESCYGMNLRGGLALVIGNESNGPAPVFIEKADRVIGVPMAGTVESLNAAVAAAVVMYEKVRQEQG